LIGVIEKMNIIPILVYVNPIGNSTGCWKYSGWILYPGESRGPGILLSGSFPPYDTPPSPTIFLSKK